MKIVIATDSFKGSMTTLQAAEGLEKGIRRVFPNSTIETIPVADGGEGTVDAMIGGLGGHIETVEVVGPMQNPVRARFGMLSSGEAVIEMAAASGLGLVTEANKDVCTATTYGTGQLILSALDRGCKAIYIGIGSSATNDGGAGMAQALGIELLDRKGESLAFGGAALKDLVTVDMSRIDRRIGGTQIVVMSDVENPLCGELGASQIYGPQKGATVEQIDLLDASLAHYAKIVEKKLSRPLADIPGAGAAGGLGFGLMAFVNAQMRSGIQAMLDSARFDEKISDADLIVTGEGCLDGQSSFGKTPSGIAKWAAKRNIPVIAIAGSIGPGANGIYQCGIESMIAATCAPMSLQEALLQSGTLLADAAERAMRFIRVGRNMR